MDIIYGSSPALEGLPSRAQSARGRRGRKEGSCGIDQSVRTARDTPFLSLVSSNNEDSIKSFQEELQAEIEDISDFINKEKAFKQACAESDWRSALFLRKGTWTGDSSKDMEEILTKEALGIQHIVECPALVPLLKTWNTADNEEKKKEAEQKIEAFFTEEIKMIFIPTPGMEEERKEWNRCHPMKSEFNHLEQIFSGFILMMLVWIAVHCGQNNMLLQK